METINIKESINKITEEARLLYSMKTQRAYLKDRKEENNLTQQYKAREIYELLQNIDDAAPVGQQCIASIEYSNGCLSVSNNGEPFSISTFQRLCQGSVSGKDGKYIGCKGIGFRSVLNWSDEISIYSGAEDKYISAMFSREYAEKQLQKLLEESDDDVKKHLKEQIEDLEKNGFDSSYPIFRAPEYIDTIDKNYDTVIKLKIKKGLEDSIISSLKEVERYRYILLFLPHLQQIEFKIEENYSITYKKESPSENVVRLTINNNGEESSEEFYYFERVEQLNGKCSGADKVLLGIAIPCNADARIMNPTLYTFFPILGLPSPFPALLHATFFLDDNRNDLDLRTEDTINANKEVFKMLLQFYIDTVVEKISPERRLGLLLPVGMPTNCKDAFKFNDSLSRLGCETDFITECKEKELLYTVNGTCIKGTDAPIVLDRFPEQTKLLKDDEFSLLVDFIEDDGLRAFAKRLAGDNGNAEEYLCNAINGKSGQWDVTDRIAVFKWWHSLGYTKLPNLLKTIKGDFVDTGNGPCFLSEDETPVWVENIPQWAKISVLHHEDQEEMQRQFKSEIDAGRANRNNQSESWKRVLSGIINKGLVNIQEQSSRQVVISPINTSVVDFSQAKEFLEWLWSVWNDSGFEDNVKKIDFVVPAAGAVCPAKEVYMGESYDNGYGAEIFRLIGGYNELCDIGFGAPDEKSLQAFLQDLGVSKYPRLHEVNKDKICADDDGWEYKFVKFVLDRHPLQCESVRPYSATLYSIDKIESILEKLSTKQILRWIFSDSKLRNAIENDVQPKNCSIGYLPPSKWYPIKHNSGWQLPSYMRFLLSNYCWIEVGEEKYSPKQLMIANNDYLNESGLKCISESDVEELADGICDKEELRHLLILLGVKTTYLELDADKFYGLLLDLPKNDEEKAKKVFKELYRTIIDNSPNIEKKYRVLYESDSEKRKEFEQNGVVLVKKGGASCFEPISKAFFSSSAVVDVNDRYPIDVPARRGKRDDFNNILCIKPFEIDYTVKSKETSCCNDAFQSDLQSFIPCIMAYRRGKKDEVFNLTVELVKTACIEDKNGGREYECEGRTQEYTLLKMQNRHWLICVGDETEYGNLKKELIADNLVQIFNVLFNFPSKDFLNKVEQLFIYSQRQREHFIEDELGSVEEIEIAMQEIRQSGEFYDKLKDLFGYNDGDDVYNAVMDIDWNNISIGDLKKIAALLVRTEITLEALNDRLERDISVAPYNRAALMRCYETDSMNVRSYIYTAIEGDSARHCELDNLCCEFERRVKLYNGDGLENIDFDCQQVYGGMKATFFDDKEVICGGVLCDYKDIKAIYDDNVNRLKPVFEGCGLSLNDFANSPENNSLLFFEYSEQLQESVKSCIEKLKNQVQEENDVKTDCNYLSSLIESAGIKDDLSSGKVMSKGTNAAKKGGVTKATTERAERRNKRQGNIAEYIVVLKLVAGEISQVNEYFKDCGGYDVFWVSGAAKDIQTIEGDTHAYDCSVTDDGAGYDIKLVSKDKGKVMYIEVKSSSGDNCSFFMSENERSTAIRKNSETEQYRIVFVSNIRIDGSESKPGITFIDAPLEEAFNSHPTQYNVVFDEEKLTKANRRVL